MKKWKYLSMTATLSAALFLAACGDDTENTDAGAETEEGTDAGTEEAALSGEVIGDGSSTVAPITEGLVEEYSAAQPDVRVSVGVSGTGGGFEKFINGETDFSNASRDIKDEEIAELEAAGIEYTGLELAYDGLSVVVNPENTWAENLTLEQLKAIWVEDGTTKKWSDIDPSWPDEEIVFYSPGADSGTFDYFNEVVLEEEELVNSATLSEDDNVLVQGVRGDKNAIGFFGYAYYIANEDSLKPVSINGVEPSGETIASGDYTPLSRSLYVYVNNEAVKTDDAVYDFMKFTLENAGEMSELVGYVPLNDDEYQAGLDLLEGLR
ncbi:PstS family phosphate ABC transporter substrate-binding protein [Caryophanon tenue]|uniref:Phosphate-binding protein n=1 Tax=Caryophanon tenue TaxID=33978 RepID=A0A1C0YN28_9BACL|nr:PstS family phosphate ABC transporter substrate-binding protein [Caryophanon tenue]OCS88580.1 phosphate-binding protein [Caryophanon tenue]